MTSVAATLPPGLLRRSTTAFTAESQAAAVSFSWNRATGFSPIEKGPTLLMLRIRPSTSIRATLLPAASGEQGGTAISRSGPVSGKLFKTAWTLARTGLGVYRKAVDSDFNGGRQPHPLNNKQPSKLAMFLTWLILHQVERPVQAALCGQLLRSLKPLNCAD